MKQQDYALLVIIVIISAMISVFLGRQLIKPPTGQAAKYEVAEKISAKFPQADPTVFNDSAINPTRSITIGNDQNQQPIQRQR